MKNNSFILKGDICYSLDQHTLAQKPNHYLICEDGLSKGVFSTVPDEYQHLPVTDYTGKMIVPGLCDLHMHAPQYTFRSLGMDLELLDWLNTHTFPEETKYSDTAYAEKAYTRLIDDLLKGPNTRLCVYATLHTPATMILMNKLEASGLISFVGKVNMDRNSTEDLTESTADSAAATKSWIEECLGRYKYTYPILTPRFIPSCTDELMHELSQIQKTSDLPVQSHLSENPGEIAWVQELCPDSHSYSDAYDRRGMLTNKTIMAHCVWSDDEEIALLKDRGVTIAHCPQSNTNLSSGIAPVRKMLNAGVMVGLGSDVAGGVHTSIFRAMSDAVQVSKLRWRLVDQQDAPLSLEEAFYLGTLGGGAYFGKVGSFEPGYECDALIIDDSSLASPFELSLDERLAKIVYLSDDRHIIQKVVQGRALL